MSQRAFRVPVSGAPTFFHAKTGEFIVPGVTFIRPRAVDQTPPMIHRRGAMPAFANRLTDEEIAAAAIRKALDTTRKQRATEQKRPPGH